MDGSLEDLVKRFHDLEVSQAKLRDQVQWMLEEGIEGHALGMRRREGDDAGPFLPGHFADGPYRSVLKHIGHALHIYRPHTGEIIFWNQSAENLYGWMEDEALGKRVGDLLMNEERIPSLGKIMDRLHRGQSWSGQLSFVKKSGEMFMAMVTKSPLYEDDAFVGVITVSSDAALLDDNCSEMLRGYQDQAHGPARTCKRVRWRQPPPITSSHGESCQVGDESGKKELAVSYKFHFLPLLEGVTCKQSFRRIRMLTGTGNISRMQQKTFISNLLTLSLLRLPSFFAADHHPLTCSLLSIVAQARGPYHPYDIDDKVRDPNSAIVKCEAEIVSEENERSKMHALLMAGELDKEGEDDGEPHAEESCR
ncbi:hypothetical protein BHM03_00031508 [Ensete ventricosum]|uniref:PAS domain-containing protein n=1 Tax=Ensete ventricosum TaxID=4639 RepID=A0A445MIJ7_ENSVE|nr:hypothetical protein BHM03_00031508 [Ensete ventricosum]